jgi:arylsulfatase A-like enzyme
MFRLSILFALLLAWSAPALAQSNKPNIVVILTDDQTDHMITGRDAAGRPFMPFLMSKAPLARRFDTAIFSQSLCCPSRTSLLTGMYPQNHGVLNNTGENGGYYRYLANGLDQKSWAKTLLPEYYTGVFGKFLNGYTDPASVPRGWLRWYAIYAGAANMFNWSASHNGKAVTYRGSTDTTYSTNVLANLVSTTIKQQATQQKPFAFLFSPIAPHLPAIPAKEFTGLYANEPFAPGLKPSFNEADVADKPGYVRAIARLSSEQRGALERKWRRMLESGRSIDKAIKTIWQALEASGQLANTYIIFASDNGYLWGEHRLMHKVAPYRESIKSTMLIWGSGVVPGIDHRIVTNADLMPTFMEIAGKPIPEWVDGRSLLPLLHGGGPAWRQQLLVHGIPPIDREDGALDTTGSDFLAIATRWWTFVRYSGETEFYDLRTDPYELSNAAASLAPAVVSGMLQRIDELYACAGVACKTLEDSAPPATASFR